jgi:hypothetical protein
MHSASHHEPKADDSLKAVGAGLTAMTESDKPDSFGQMLTGVFASVMVAFPSAPETFDTIWSCEDDGLIAIGATLRSRCRDKKSPEWSPDEFVIMVRCVPVLQSIRGK